jgi:hypothetical protein
MGNSLLAVVSTRRPGQDSEVPSAIRSQRCLAGSLGYLFVAMKSLFIG